MSLLDERLLLAFIAVAEERHFGRAAQRLHLSQPPVSQRIRQLEDHLGVTLLTRSTRQVSLTPAGTELYRRAIKLTRDARAAEAAVKRLARGDHGELRLGFTRTAASNVVPRLLAHYREHKPDINLYLQEDWSTELMNLLLQEKLDVALLRQSSMTTHPAIRLTLVEREPLWLTLPRHHRLSRKRRIHFEELHGENLVGYSAGTAQSFHEILERVLAHYGIKPNILHYSAVPTILALVSAGMGVALIPRSAAQLRPRDTAALPMVDPDNVANVELYAATRIHDLNPLIGGALDDLLALCGPAAR